MYICIYIYICIYNVYIYGEAVVYMQLPVLKDGRLSTITDLHLNSAAVSDLLNDFRVFFFPATSPVRWCTM